MPEFDDDKKWSIFVYPLSKYNRYTDHFYEPLFADHFSFLLNKDDPTKISFHQTIYYPTSRDDSAITGYKDALHYPFKFNEIVPRQGYETTLFTLENGTEKFPERESVIDIMRFPYLFFENSIEINNTIKKQRLKLTDFVVEDENIYTIWNSNKIENIMLFCIERNKYYFTAIIHDELEHNDDEPEKGFTFILKNIDIRNIRNELIRGIRNLGTHVTT